MNNLEIILSEGNKFLKEKFDLTAPRAKIQFCDELEWGRISTQLNFPEAFYNSSEELIYAPEKATLPILIHEYFGHALFSEQSSLGKKLKSYEERFICTRNLKIKKEYEEFISKIRPVQEAFAMSMEKIILENLGFGGLWNEREKQLKQRAYYPAFYSLMSDMLNKGFLSVLYELGFPKSPRKNILLRFAMENLKSFDGLKYLFLYGSKKRDIDMLAVYNDSIRLTKENIFHKNAADIILLNETVFLKKLDLLDIEITDPLLTGTMLYGNEDAYDSLIKRLRKTSSTPETIEYSKKKSLQTFNSALFFLAQHKYNGYENLLALQPSEKVSKDLLANQTVQPSQELLCTLVNLSFSLSYDLAAKEQEKGRNIILFKEFQTKSCLFQELLTYIKDIEYGAAQLEEYRTKQFIELVRNKLVR